MVGSLAKGARTFEFSKPRHTIKLQLVRDPAIIKWDPWHRRGQARALLGSEPDNLVLQNVHHAMLYLNAVSDALP